VRELSSPRVDQSASCPVRELAIRELAYPRVVQLPCGLWHRAVCIADRKHRRIAFLVAGIAMFT